MISITPINNTNFIQTQRTLKSQSRTAFAEKADSFECKSPSFKGKQDCISQISIIEKAIKETLIKVKKNPNIKEKAQLVENLFQYYVGIFLNVSKTTENPKEIDLIESLYHDINTDLANIGEYASVVLYCHKSKTQSEFDQVFDKSARMAIRTIKQYKFFLQNDFAEKSMSPIDIFNICVKSLKNELKNENLNLMFEGRDILNSLKPEQFAEGDFSLKNYQIFNIFIGILKNAIKNSPKNSIIKLKAEKQKIGEKNFLKFTCTDTGKGMTKEEQQKVLTKEIASNLKGKGYDLYKVIKYLTADNLEIKSPLYPDNKEFPGTEISAYILLRDEK